MSANSFSWRHVSFGCPQASALSSQQQETPGVVPLGPVDETQAGGSQAQQKERLTSSLTSLAEIPWVKMFLSIGLCGKPWNSPQMLPSLVEKL